MDERDNADSGEALSAIRRWELRLELVVKTTE
jgi:hypothetical protein